MKYQVKITAHRRDDSGIILERRTLIMSIEAPNKECALNVIKDMLQLWADNIDIEQIKEAMR